MGGRSRYQPSYDRERARKHYAEVMLRGDPPATLSEAEREQGEVSVTRSPHLVAVAAWVRYGATPVVIEGFTNTWTSRAVEVAWKTPKGDTHRAWVWANAVRHRQITAEERLRLPPGLPE
jgi:hypothetical protein